MSQAAFEKSANNTFTVHDARRLAYELHMGQTDHTGNDYILHPERVANNVTRFFPDAPDYVVIAAWLHDTIEDCKINGKNVDEDYLLSRGVPQEAIDIVTLVTKPDGDERTYDEVIDDLIESGNVGAMMVKLADNGDNLHPVRTQELFVSQMEQDNPGKAMKLKTRYIDSVKKLSNALGISAQGIFNLIQQAPTLKTEFTI